MPLGRTDIKDGSIFHGKPVVGWSSDLLLKTLARALDRLVVRKDDPLVRPDVARPSLLETPDPRGAGGLAVGLALSGRRTGVLSSDVDLASMEEDLALASRLHVPLTIIHTLGMDGSAAPSQADFWRSLSNGRFGFYAGDVQEAIDLPLIAIRVAEHALLPGICAHDSFRSRYDVSSVLSQEDDLIESYLGVSNEQMDAATPAQRMTLRSERRKVPTFFSSGRPAGLNPQYTAHEERLVESGHAAFFSSHLYPIIEEAFEDFGALTGRFYRPIDTYRIEDADYVVITTGAAGESVKPVIDFLRTSSRLRIGGARLRLLNPFPSDALRNLVSDTRAVTILDFGISSDALLSQAVRSAIDPNGPDVFTFAAPSGHKPSAGDWLGAIAHMTSTQSDKKSFFVIPPASGRRSRLPGLGRTDQVLNREYPEVPWLNARASGEAGMPGSPSVHLFGMRADLMAAAAGTLARVYSTVQGITVEGALTPGYPPEYTLALNTPTGCTAVLDAKLLRNDSVLNRMTRESVVVVPSTKDSAQFWSSLPEAFRQVADERNLSVLAVGPADPDGEEDDSILEDHIEVYMVLGAVLRSVSDGTVSIDDVSGRLEETLVRDGLPLKVATRLANGLSRGFHSALSSRGPRIQFGGGGVPHFVRDDASVRDDGSEPETPWTLRESQLHDDTVFDPARFWTTVGFECASGRTNLLAPDPYLASRIVPAQTSVVSARSTESPPEWLPENCTGCGLCWTFCPHSALPVTVAGMADFIETGKSRIEARGGATTQVQRLGKHLAKRMHKLIAADGLNRFTSLRAVGEEAVGQLLEAAGLDDQSEQAARTELEAVVSEIGVTKIARTESFFEIPEQGSRGSGRVLTIAVDPDACTACGICAAVCPEAAIETLPAAPTPRGDLGQARTVAGSLSSDPNLDFATERFPDRALAHRLVDRDSYYAALGGGRSAPGSGARMALHLVAAVAESAAKPRRNELLSSVSELETRLKENIRTLLSKSVEINDFNEFAGRLRGLSGDSGRVDVHDLLSVDSEGTIDTARLQQLSDSLLGLESLRESLSVDGSLASGLVAVFGDAPTITADAEFPLNPFPFPWINAGKGNAFPLARGVFEGLADETLAAVTVIRKARQVADDTFDPSVEMEISLDSLTEEEWGLLPAVCLFVERLDSATLSTLDEGSPVRIFWLDGLDGRPGHGVSPLPVWSPNLLFSQTAPAFPTHFLSAVDDTFQSLRSSLTRIYAPEPERQEFPPSQTIDRMKSAVSTRVFPLFTYRPDRSMEWTERWSLEGNPGVADDWPSENAGRLTPAEWFAVEGRFARFFEVLPRKTWDDSHVAFDTFLALGEDERDGVTPYVELDDAAGTRRRLRAASEIVEAAETIRTNWRLLQEMAGVRSTLLDVARKQVEEELRVSMDAERERLISESDARVEEIRSGYDEIFREKLVARLLTLSGFSGASATLGDWLADMEREGRTIHSDTPDEQSSGG